MTARANRLRCCYYVKDMEYFRLQMAYRYKLRILLDRQRLNNIFWLFAQYYSAAFYVAIRPTNFSIKPHKKLDFFAGLLFFNKSVGIYYVIIYTHSQSFI